MFSAMRVRNFRLYSAGQSIANTGTWMLSIAQDWLVLELTNSAAAVGITMSMQFLPTLLLGVHGGALADRFDKRRLLIATQLANGILTALLAALTLSGHINAFEVYGFALAGGFVFVVDNPARQVLVNELVPASDVRNAIGLNAAVFQTTRLFGPAVAGVLISGVGTGWAFAAAAACFLGPIATLLLIDPRQMIAAVPVPRSHGQLRETLRYVAGEPRLAWTLLLVGMVGTLGLNFPIVLTGMARDSFHGTAALYGLFNIMLGLGSIIGALVAGSRSNVRMRQVVAGAAVFGVCEAMAALAPDLPVFLVLLAAMGLANLASRPWPTHRSSSPATLPTDPASWASTCWCSSAAPPSAPRSWGRSLRSGALEPACSPAAWRRR